ncbi:MAG: hypothetical protein ABMA00_05485 [Gemmatimonas sp.]
MPLDAEVINRIAQSITSDLLTPYHAPARPFPIGTTATFCVRPDYRAQVPDGSSRPEVSADATRLARHIAHALGTTTVNVSADGTASFEGDVVELRDTVIVCGDTLQRLHDPTALLREMHRLLRDAALVVISLPLRPLTADADDLGPPRVPAHAREWTFPELQACIDAYGIEPLFGGMLPDGVGVIVASARMATAAPSVRAAD